MISIGNKICTSCHDGKRKGKDQDVRTPSRIHTQQPKDVPLGPTYRKFDCLSALWPWGQTLDTWTSGVMLNSKLLHISFDNMKT